ncbi:MAG: M14 family metallopeptidase, partial [Saprospiraceae bacterium]
KNLFIVFLLLLTVNSFAQNDYFFPTNAQFDPNIPTPAQFLGYEIGDFHTRHDRMVSYMEKLAEVSDKANFQIIGYTNERRPQIVLTVTTPDNYTNLENIRQAHLKLCDPSTATTDVSDMPVIILHGYNVHGNEPSSTEAAMLTAYYLVAETSAETQGFLKDAVTFIDPAYNPDGRDRHTNWANMHHGFPPVADPADREHNEVWPRGRTNHYWFDLNRDWLPLAQVESRNRMAFYHQWLPNVATDYHEMGASSTYFFEPTEPFGSENPLVGRKNYDDINNLFAKYFKAALDEVGSLYFTKEAFDNSYPGYGSTYPDMHGGLGLVFEQASSRGHIQETTTKPITFAFTIRNHTRTSIATVRAAVENREFMLNHQQDFFKESMQMARKKGVKGYVFGDSNDNGKTKAFLDLLLKHQIKTYPVNENVGDFQKGTAWYVPAEQSQYRMVSTFFEPVKSFYDSVFYDASAWTVALAFDMPYQRYTSGKNLSMGNALTAKSLLPIPTTLQTAEYAYLMEWNDYNAPKALYQLLKYKVFCKTSFKPFSAEVNGQRRDFGYGTIMVSIADQNRTPEQLRIILQSVMNETNVPIHGVNTGFSLQGIDLGSRNFQTLDLPKVAMLVGDGVSGYEAGEIWHLMDTRIGMPVTKVETTRFGRLDLANYEVLILVSGGYGNLGENGVTKIKDWVRKGGTLITQRTATQWAIKNGLAKATLKKNKPTYPKKIAFADAREVRGARAIGGSIYMTDIDISHPMAFGYSRSQLPVYRNHTVFVEPSTNPVANVSTYAANPHLDGYIHAQGLATLKGSASLMVSQQGRGRTILMMDNPNFRGFWYGTNKLFWNAVFLGGVTNVPGF